MENNWYNLSVSEASKKLDTDLEKGLKAEEVEKRQAQYGFNELKENLSMKHSI